VRVEMNPTAGKVAPKTVKEKLSEARGAA